MPVAFVNSQDALLSGAGASGGAGAGAVASTWADKPAASKEGRIWFQTDGPYLAYDDGASWSYKAYGTYAAVPPDFTGYTWVNQSTSSIDTSRGSGDIFIAAGAGINIRAYVRSIPDADLVYTVMRSASNQTLTYSNHGLCFRNSSTGQFVLLGLAQAGVYNVFRYNSPTSFSATYATSPFFVNAGWHTAPRWERLVRSGSTRYFQLSVDGTNWETLTSHAWTDFMTPNQVGVYGNSENVGINIRMSVLSMQLA